MSELVANGFNMKRKSDFGHEGRKDQKRQHLEKRHHERPSADPVTEYWDWARKRLRLSSTHSVASNGSDESVSLLNLLELF